MESRFQPCLGCLADTGTVTGVGVFASRDIAAGETVEVSPVIQISRNFEALDTELQRRVFDWGRLASRPGVRALALGYGSMYNHANPANLRYAAQADGTAIRFVAVTDVRAGDEFTINYNDTGGEPVSREDNWFRVARIAPHAPAEKDE